MHDVALSIHEVWSSANALTAFCHPRGKPVAAGVENVFYFRCLPPGKGVGIDGANRVPREVRASGKQEEHPNPGDYAICEDIASVHTHTR